MELMTRSDVNVPLPDALEVPAADAAPLALGEDDCRCDVVLVAAAPPLLASSPSPKLDRAAAAAAAMAALPLRSNSCIACGGVGRSESLLMSELDIAAFPLRMGVVAASDIASNYPLPSTCTCKSPSVQMAENKVPLGLEKSSQLESGLYPAVLLALFETASRCKPWPSREIHALARVDVTCDSCSRCTITTIAMNVGVAFNLNDKESERQNNARGREREGKAQRWEM
jgi:hypothetical protein